MGIPCRICNWLCISILFGEYAISPSVSGHGGYYPWVGSWFVRFCLYCKDVNTLSPHT